MGVRTPNGEPRPTFEPAKVPGKLTDAEKIARYEQWAPFGAASGTYELKGNTLTLRSIVAKNETAMSGKPDPQRAEFKVDANILWRTFTAADGKSETLFRPDRPAGFVLESQHAVDASLGISSLHSLAHCRHEIHRVAAARAENDAAGEEIELLFGQVEVRLRRLIDTHVTGITAAPGYFAVTV